jgi:hypothetical protein
MGRAGGGAGGAMMSGAGMAAEAKELEAERKKHLEEIASLREKLAW